MSTLYNVTVDLGSAENGNVPAIHPRVIARSSAFGLPTRHSQSFKPTLQRSNLSVSQSTERSPNIFVNTLRISFFDSLAVQLPSFPPVSLTAPFSASCRPRPSFLPLCSSGAIFFHLAPPSTFSFPLSINFKPHSLHPSPPTPPSHSNTRYPPFQTHQFSNEPFSVFRSLCLLKPHVCVLSTPSFPFSLSCLYSSGVKDRTR